MRTHQYAQKKKASQSSLTPVTRPSKVQSSVQPPQIQAKSNKEGLAEHAERLKKFQRLGSSMIQMGPPRLDNNTTSSMQPQPWIQRKLTIGQPGDKYEQEADRVASQVVQQISAPAFQENNLRQSIQREKDLEGVMYARCFRAALQRKQAIASGEASPDLESAINSARSSGQPLDAGLKQSMGQAMGADFSGVRVHTDAQSDQLNQSIQARAFTTGQDVFFRSGTYQPGKREGQELIAHELTHVVQQSLGFPEIQRRVGFEFEDNDWEAWIGKRMPKEKFYQKQTYNVRPAERKELLYQSKNKFNLEADDSKGANHPSIEFVTDPFDTNEKGLSSIDTTFDEIEDLMTRIGKISGRSGKKGEFKEKEVNKVFVRPKDHELPSPKSLGVDEEVWFSKGKASAKFKMQATSGISLEDLPTIMKYFGPQSELSQETEKETEMRDPARELIYDGKTEPGSRDDKIMHPVLTNAPRLAQVAINYLKKNSKVFGKSDDTAALKGFFSQIILYLKNLTFPQKNQAKYLIPLLARTSFSAMFQLLPEDQQAALSEDKAGLFIKATLKAVNKEKILIRNEFRQGVVTNSKGKEVDLGDGGQVDIAYDTEYKRSSSVVRSEELKLQGLTIEEWLKGIACKNIDYLAQGQIESFLLEKKTSPVKAKAAEGSLESFAVLGKTEYSEHTEPPDVKGLTKLAIFENRMIEGTFNVTQAKEKALSYLKFFIDLKNQPFIEDKLKKTPKKKKKKSSV